MSPTRVPDSDSRYKRMPLAGLTVAILSLAALAIWPAAMPMPVVLLALAAVGGGTDWKKAATGALPGG